VVNTLKGYETEAPSIGGRMWAGLDPDQGESALMSHRLENTRGGSLRLLAAGCIGHVLEWSDVAVYGFFADCAAQKEDLHISQREKRIRPTSIPQHVRVPNSGGPAESARLRAVRPP
jgi:hypothetical protein